MSLLELWRSNRAAIEAKQIKQIIGIAGTGKLLDGSNASSEFRSFLSQVSVSCLVRYVDQCLSLEDRFSDSGWALQDLVNELGRRLGFDVDNGRYRSGHDGLWKSATKAIVVEVKTSDNFRIKLDTLAEYRRLLIDEGQIREEASSILLVVAQTEDTQDLEAQIRGSRCAWDVRLVSVKALVGLAKLRSRVDDPDLVQRISEVLVPKEYTRVDGIIELVFAAADDAQIDEGDDAPPRHEGDESSPKRAAAITPAAFHGECILKAEQKLKCSLVQESRTVFRSPDGRITVLCLVSKAHVHQYWFAFRPRHAEILRAAAEGWVVLGCGSAEVVLAIPWREFELWLEGMFKTENEDRSYWHITVDTTMLRLQRRKEFAKVDLKPYLLSGAAVDS